MKREENANLVGSTTQLYTLKMRLYLYAIININAARKY